MAQPQAIDFEKLKQEELLKANKVFTFKQVPREDLYNNLQVKLSIVSSLK